MLDHLGGPAEGGGDHGLAVLHGLEVHHPERVEADGGRDEHVGRGIGGREVVALQPAGRHHASVDAESPGLPRELRVVDLAAAHHQQAEVGVPGREQGEHLEQLPDPLLRVQAPPHGQEGPVIGPDPLAQGADRLLGGQAIPQGQAVVDRGVHRHAVRAQHLCQRVRDGRHPMHVPLQDAADARIAARPEAEALAGDALARPRHDVVLLATSLLPAVEAGELLVAEGHHVVGRQHHCGTGLACLGQGVIAQVRVQAMGMDDVGAEALEQCRQRRVDDRVVQASPGTPAHRVVRDEVRHGHPHHLGVASLLLRAHGPHHQALVALRLESGRQVEGQPAPGPDARVGELGQEEDPHRRPSRARS